ncbi:EpsG family protein [Companilactobacillus nodensis]|uniref:EpsG family protein n=1 Tax=Companilactobacillus nodensis TaxID=460870 RepID=UPI00070514CB|nr:EpsG family protein [Companilactobacillus nodensis]
MIFYSINLAIFLIYSLFTNSYYKDRRAYFWLILIHLTLLLGLRSSIVGTDTPQYVSFYLAQNSNFNGNGTLVYSAVSGLINHLTNGNYHVFLFVLSLATVFCILKAVELFSGDENLMFLSIYIYITFYFYFESFNIQRQMLAISMVMLAMALLYRHHFVGSIVLFTMAVGIHSTAIFAIVGFLIWYIKKSKLTFSLMIIVAALSNLFLNSLLSNFSQLFDHYQMYTDAVLISGGGTLLLGIFLLVMVCSAIFLTDILHDKSAAFTIFMTAIGAVLYIVGSKSQLIIRMADYFAIYSIIAVPQAVIAMGRRFRNQRLVDLVLTTIVIFVGLAIFYYKLMNNLGEIIPYSLNSI